jgi:hypothetical protein
MLRRIKDYLKNPELGQETRHENMAVYPLFASSGIVIDYLSLDEALENQVIEIAEVSESGDVPNLKVRNRGTTPVLIVAGEELVGAKQNRMVNATFLVAGGLSLIIPVSCVEQGRWTYRTRGFASEKRISSPQLRQRMEEDVGRSVRVKREYRADQHRIWDEVAAKSVRMRVHSPTVAMAAIFESYDDRLRGYTNRFSQAENQRGVLVTINGAVAGLEVFDSGGHLAKYYAKVIQSYALDAIDLQIQGEPRSKGPDLEPGEWLAEIMESIVTQNPSLGLGTDLRITDGKVTGSGLLHEGGLLYLSVFDKGNGGEQANPRSGMTRASRRGSFRR